MSKRVGRSLPYGRTGLIAAFFVAALIWGAYGKVGSLACANSISCTNDLTGRYEDGATGTYLGRSVTPPTYIASSLASSVLGKTTEEKRIEVNLTTQQLIAFEGKKPVMTFPVSTGKWGRTPTGEFTIWIKLKYTRMEGGSGSDYYNLPNVPYVMFYSNDEVAKSRGFSLHGAYWHNNFGYVMSHGCVNLRPADAEKLYTWADPPTDGNITYVTKDNPGTKVTIYE